MKKNSFLITVTSLILLASAAKAESSLHIPPSCQDLIVPALKETIGASYKDKLGELKISDTGDFLQPANLNPKWILQTNQTALLRSSQTTTQVQMPIDISFSRTTEEDFKRFSLSKTVDKNTPRLFYKLRVSEYKTNSPTDKDPKEVNARKTFFFVVENGKCQLTDTYAEEGPKQEVMASKQLCAEYATKKTPTEQTEVSNKFFDNCNIMKANAVGLGVVDKTCAEAKSPHDLKVEGVENDMFEMSCETLKKVNAISKIPTGVSTKEPEKQKAKIKN